MKLTQDRDNGVTIIALEGNLDSAGVKELEETVSGLLKNGQSCLLFDFTDLDYINSSGLRILVMAYQQLQPANGRVAICGTKDYIQEIFDISGYDRIFSMFPSRRDALDGL